MIFYVQVCLVVKMLGGTPLHRSIRAIETRRGMETAAIYGVRCLV